MFSISLMGIALLISGLLPVNGYLVFVLCSVLMGLSSPFYNGVQMALIQEKIQPEYLGRVFGLLGSLVSFAMPIGLIVSGFSRIELALTRGFCYRGLSSSELPYYVHLFPPSENWTKKQKLSSYDLCKSFFSVHLI